MNLYYATGTPIFEGPLVKRIEAPYGTVGHLTNHLYNYQIKVEYKDNQGHIDMFLTAQNGETLFVSAKKHNQMRITVYKWVRENSNAIL